MADRAADRVEQIVQAVLYEGYLLWPYRRSALKNQKRWTFGGVYPEPYSTARGSDDPWLMQTECLVQPEPSASLDVRVRFLQVVQRDVGRVASGELTLTDELTVGGQRYLAWQEATEREIAAADLPVDGVLAAPHRAAIDIPADERTEWLVDDSGRRAGGLIRHWQALRGHVEIAAEQAADGLVRVSVRVANTTDWRGEDREQALLRTLVSTHTVIRVDRGGFLSLMDPPEHLRVPAQRCRNIGTWPVLAGEPGERHMMLSAPIILYDHPQVAPESPQDLFDATEIDQLLTLNILSLTDSERREMADSDPRARRILERCASLTPEQLLQLHGTMREVRS